MSNVSLNSNDASYRLHLFKRTLARYIDIDICVKFSQ